MEPPKKVCNQSSTIRIEVGEWIITIIHMKCKETLLETGEKDMSNSTSKGTALVTGCLQVEGGTMTLQERMNAMKEKVERTLSAEKRDIRHRATEDLRRSGILDRVIKVGAPIPEFTLPNARGEKVSSADMHSRGPLVMTFYRGVW